MCEEWNGLDDDVVAVGSGGLGIEIWGGGHFRSGRLRVRYVDEVS